MLPAGAAGQELELRISENILVARQPHGELLVEPHVSTHPSDPQHLLAVGWIHPATDAEREGEGERCAAFLSLNGGTTWARHEFPGEGCGDPWVTLTEHGAILTALGTHPLLPDSRRQLLAFFSPDGGHNWHDVPQSLGRGHDGPRSLGGADGTIYVLSGQGWLDAARKRRWSVYVGRARPGIPHVQTMDRILPSNLNLNSEGLAALSDGTLVITYHDYQRPVGGPGRAFRSRAGALEGRRVWAMLSADGGESFSIPLLATESCFDRPTFLAVDMSSGEYRDRLYHVCSGDDYKSILLATSADRGEEWSDATPIEPVASQRGSRREPQVAVNAQGIVAVAWMDRRDDASGRCYAPYVAASADGGRTFSPAVRVASKVSCPEIERLGSAGGRWPTGGDYFGLAAGADGRFHVLWPDARDGTYEFWTAAVSVRSTKGQ